MTNEERKKLLDRLERLLWHLVEVEVLSKSLSDQTSEVAKEIDIFRETIRSGGSLDEFNYQDRNTREEHSMPEVLRDIEKRAHKMLRFLRANLKKALKD